jgi:Flp pilus assembly protein TadD
MRAQTFLDLGGRWLGRPQFYDAAVEFVGAGVQLYPKDAKLRELLGDFLARKGRPAEAAENYRAAYNLDPTLAKGMPADEYVAGRLKAAAAQKQN